VWSKPSNNLLSLSTLQCRIKCPDEEIRKKRYQLLICDGVVIEDENGDRISVSPEHATNYIARMPDQKKNLYEV